MQPDDIRIINRSDLQEFCRRYHVRRLAIFGSALRDDFRPDSDLDFLVSFEPKAKINFMTLGKMKRELSLMFQRPIDLVPQEGLKPAIRDEVLNSAKEVYTA